MDTHEKITASDTGTRNVVAPSARRGLYLLCAVLAMTAMPARSEAQTHDTAGRRTTTGMAAIKVARADISLAGAERAIDAALAEAARNGWTASVAVVDAAGELVAFRKADGAIGISPSVAIGMARTAALLQAPSKEFEDFVNSGRPSFLSTPGVTALEGGIPVVVDGQVIGAVGVSGAHGANDSQVALAGAAAVR